MFLFGVILVTLLSLGYRKQSQQIILDAELENIEKLSKEVALHFESHLREKSKIAKTLSSSPLIKEALLKSNTTYADLTDAERKQEIENLNQQWKNISKIDDPFIQAHMTNTIADYLTHQHILFPGEYGEIFLTNRYGVMIATTGKLSTLAHAHKYWWKACYDDGNGRIFLDDRGFDTSVEGYVLGVVVPIIDEGQIIGILKCNVNIMGRLDDVVQNYGQRNPGMMKIVRTGGLVVSAPGVTPLSTQVDKKILKSLRTKESGTALIEVNGETQLIAFCPIPITLGADQTAFGGRQQSLDHTKGNKGEAWHVLISLNKATAIATANEVTSAIVFSGTIFILFAAAIALLLGKMAAKPIVKLAESAKRIGEGHLETRASVSSNDEIGLLGQSLNTMAKNLQETMISRNSLMCEVERRKKEEKKKEQLITELQQALHEVKTLRGIIPICSFCKKIRDDTGYWNQVEDYITQHSQADFTHSLCPDCLEKHYP